MWPMYEFWGGLFWLFPLSFLLVIVLFALWLDRTFGQAGRPPNIGGSALDIAKRRFAQGEISKDEFETIRKTIA